MDALRQRLLSNAALGGGRGWAAATVQEAAVGERLVAELPQIEALLRGALAAAAPEVVAAMEAAVEESAAAAAAEEERGRGG